MTAMVGSGVLAGLFLLSLLAPAVSRDVQNLPQVVRFLDKTYGSGSQFAVAINIPADKCAADVRSDQISLQDDDAQKVKSALNSAARVYKGRQLMAAKTKPIPDKPDVNYHSEYLLLIKSNPPNASPDDPLMKTLLDRDPAGCAVFYTLNSPCVNTCSTPNKPHSIIKALQMFENRSGPQAFVFGKVWKYDENSTQWISNIKAVDSRVPVYRCDNAGCYRCVDKKSVNDKCIRN